MRMSRTKRFQFIQQKCYILNQNVNSEISLFWIVDVQIIAKITNTFIGQKHQHKNKNNNRKVNAK